MDSLVWFTKFRGLSSGVVTFVGFCGDKPVVIGDKEIKKPKQ